MTGPTRSWAQLGAAVYQMCNHYDPYLPPVSEDLARAWGRQLERHGLADAALLQCAVDGVYAQQGSGYRPLPKDITDAARAVRRDRYERSGLDSVERQQHEAICDAKAIPHEVADARQRTIAGFGFAPKLPEAEAEGRRRSVERQRKAAPPQPIPESESK